MFPLTIFPLPGELVPLHIFEPRYRQLLQDAEKRGYEPGRRERALLGDGYLRRANTSRLLARTLSGEQRRRELERARADYASCVEAFDPIVGFGFAAKNLEICKHQLDVVDRELGDYDEIPIGDR